jgi:CheY-like chemotaxis protein
MKDTTTAAIKLTLYGKTVALFGDPDQLLPLSEFLIDLEMPAMDGLKLLKFAVDTGMDKNRIVILSGRDADFLHGLCPMGTCLAVLNKFEARQKAVLDMIFNSLNKKAGTA